MQSNNNSVPPHQQEELPTPFSSSRKGNAFESNKENCSSLLSSSCPPLPTITTTMPATAAAASTSTGGGSGGAAAETGELDPNSPVTVAIMDHMFDKKLKPLEEMFDKKLKPLEEKVDEQGELMKTLLFGSPEGVLANLNPPVLMKTDIAETTGAVLKKSGCGAATWTIVKRIVREAVRKEEDDVVEYYAFSCEHCGCQYGTKLIDDDRTNLHFVSVPKELSGLVDDVCLLKSAQFGTRSCKRDRDKDIMCLKLSKLPESCDPLTVPVWSTTVTDNKDKYHGATVFGESLKAQLIGTNAVVREDGDGCWVFIVKSGCEEGDSGTLMFVITREDVTNPVIMGIYTGITELLGDRGVICPIRKRSDFNHYEIGKNPPASFQLFGEDLGAEHTFSPDDEYADNYLCVHEDSSGNRKGVYGVFIEGDFAPPARGYSGNGVAAGTGTRSSCCIL